MSALSQEISALQSEITSFHQNSTLRSEHYLLSHLQPSVHVSLGGTKVILLDSLWCEAISRSGFVVYGPVRTREIEVNISEEVSYDPWSLLTEIVLAKS